MKKKITVQRGFPALKTAAALLVGGLLAACSTDETPWDYAAADGPAGAIRLSAHVCKTADGGTTRASEYGHLKNSASYTQFVDGTNVDAWISGAIDADRASISDGTRWYLQTANVDGDRMLSWYSDTQRSTTLTADDRPYWNGRTASHQIFAFFPTGFSGGMTEGEKTVTVSTAQGAKTAPTLTCGGTSYDADLLCANQSGVTYSETPVPLTFKHLMTQITIVLENGSNTFTSAEIQAAKVTISSVATAGTYSATSGVAQVTSPTSPATVTVKTADNSSLSNYCILPPQSLSANDLTITVVCAGETYTYTIEDAIALAAGENHQFTLRLYRPASIKLMSHVVMPWIGVDLDDLTTSDDYRYMPLTIEAEDDGVTVAYNTSKYTRTQIDGNWSDWTLTAANEAVTLTSSGDKVQYIGSESANEYTFTISGSAKAYGNIMSLENGWNTSLNAPTDDYQTDVEIGANNAYKSTFKDCKTLTDASNLVLPATTLTANCYHQMFQGCTALTAGPKVLPALTLTEECYFRMFTDCNALTTAPALPATTLAAGCYRGMFGQCHALTEAPALPATDLTGCTNCYYWMFQNCTGLTTAPALPATTLAQGCYWRMFMGCTALTTAPDLPATTLAEICYKAMFKKCTSLQKAPDLPAESLLENCYCNMFENCTALEGTIKLGVTDANTVTYGTDYDSYDDRKTGTVSNMFLNAGTASSQLSEVKCTSAQIAGLINMNAETRAISSEATKGFRATPLDYQYLPLTVHMDAAGALSITKEGGLNRNCQFRSRTAPAPAADGHADEWSAWSNESPTVSGKDTEVQIIGPAVAQSSSQYLNITGTAAHHVFGNVMSLENNTVPITVNTIQKLYNDVDFSNSYACYGLFDGDSQLTGAGSLKLPVTTLVTYCYAYMFNGCTKLKAAPTLSATSLKDHCYAGMFQDCTALTVAPYLPATSLVTYCYASMFKGCTGLTTPPFNLPAETLVEGCYRQMFYDCTKLRGTINLGATSGFNFEADRGSLYQTFYNTGSDSGTDSQVECADARVAAIINYVGGLHNVGPSTAYGYYVTPVEYTYYPLTINADAAGATATNNSTGSYWYRSRGTTGTWGSWTEVTSSGSVSLEAGIEYMFIGNSNHSTSSDARLTISGSGTNTVYGNVLSIDGFTTADYNSPETFVDGIYAKTTLSGDYALAYLFSGDAGLTDASNLQMPSETETLTTSCCAYMFNGCTKLKAAPTLPAGSLAEGCYNGMFQGCTALETAPALPAPTLAEGCYESMFQGCTTLKTGPVLSATTMQANCYKSMFKGCTTLEQAPYLGALTLTTACYESMFQGCSALNSLRINANSGQLTTVNAPNMMTDAGTQNTSTTGKLYGRAGIISEMKPCGLSTEYWEYGGLYN